MPDFDKAPFHALAHKIDPQSTLHTPLGRPVQLVSGGKAGIQGTDMSTNTLGGANSFATGLQVQNGAIVDAGQISAR